MTEHFHKYCTIWFLYYSNQLGKEQKFYYINFIVEEIKASMVKWLAQGHTNRMLTGLK